MSQAPPKKPRIAVAVEKYPKQAQAATSIIISGLAWLNPLDPFNDMVTQLSRSIIKMTAPERDLVAPGKHPAGARCRKIAEIVFRTPEAAQKAHDMIAGRDAPHGSKYDIQLSRRGPATKRIYSVLGNRPSEDFGFEVRDGQAFLTRSESHHHIGKFDAQLQACLATMTWASFAIK